MEGAGSRAGWMQPSRPVCEAIRTAIGLISSLPTYQGTYHFIWPGNRGFPRLKRGLAGRGLGQSGGLRGAGQKLRFPPGFPAPPIR